MTKVPRPIRILVADDDADDRLMIRDTLTENRLTNDLRFVADGNPVTLEAPVAIAKDLGRYWLKIVELPPVSMEQGAKQ